MHVCVFLCLYLPASLWSWVLTVSFGESPNSAIADSAQSDWTDSVQALKIQFTYTFSVVRHEIGINPSLRVQKTYRNFFMNQNGSHHEEDNCTHPLSTCPSPQIPAATRPPCSGRYCRRRAGCCCWCYWGPPAATANCSAWPADGRKGNRHRDQMLCLSLLYCV